MSRPAPRLVQLSLVLVLGWLSDTGGGLVTQHQFRSAPLGSPLAAVRSPSRLVCGALCLRRPACAGVQFTETDLQCGLYGPPADGGDPSPPQGLALDLQTTTTESAATTGPTSNDHTASDDNDRNNYSSSNDYTRTNNNI
ncbi:hypothetical protein FJT64_023740 [Amphibalanus amphitrite]|uniref:Apple domain-containing protein n=1 Tax=Amphibalanus amphitrite TaxID=1232801 RepID=A0A6A4WKX1_AMPAM|nr:hypothetical protein FJT64_023740 [Amphibalanus amphitrite]